MKLFECQACGQLLQFENTQCMRCGHALGYLPGWATLSALEPAPEANPAPIQQPAPGSAPGSADNQGRNWRLLAATDRLGRYCANHAWEACNWLIPADSPDRYCPACRLNRTIPDLSVGNNLTLWQRLEAAKHRVVYSILRLGLPLVDKHTDVRAGLAFDFLADDHPDFRDGPRVMTGHAEGLITINLAEADDAERERHRRDMAEPYRTILGHFRHEIGHYYWERLVLDGGPIDDFRAMFGDERRNYAEALQAHYAQKGEGDWKDRFVSSYASSHPWEDWAETWAHYLHIVDTLETAHAFGLNVRPGVGRDASLTATADFDPYDRENFDQMVGTWLPLTHAVNSLNRSMGQPDLYPFVLGPAVIDKLRFIHVLVRQSAHRGDPFAPASVQNEEAQ